MGAGKKFYVLFGQPPGMFARWHTTYGHTTYAWQNAWFRDGHEMGARVVMVGCLISCRAAILAATCGAGIETCPTYGGWQINLCPFWTTVTKLKNGRLKIHELALQRSVMGGGVLLRTLRSLAVTY